MLKIVIPRKGKKPRIYQSMPNIVGIMTGSNFKRKDDCGQHIKILLLLSNHHQLSIMLKTISHTFLQTTVEDYQEWMNLKDYWDCYPPKVQLEGLNLNEDEKQFDLEQHQGSFPSQGTYCPQLTARYRIIQSNVNRLKPSSHKEYKYEYMNKTNKQMTCIKAGI